MTDTLVVLVTAPDGETAARLARSLVEEKLAACGNIVPAVRSIYRWEGKLCDDQEALLVLKAPAKRFPELRDRILALHPYQMPEVIALRVEDGSERYIDWIVQSMY